MCAWMFLERGASPHVKIYAQTGSSYAWADNGTVFLTPQAWTCVAISLSWPSYQQADYDAVHVVRVGMELLGTEPFSVLIDTVRVF